MTFRHPISTLWQLGRHVANKTHRNIDENQYAIEYISSDTTGYVAHWSYHLIIHMSPLGNQWKLDKCQN